MKGSITPAIGRAILSSDIMYLVIRERIQNKVVSIKHNERKLMLGNPSTKGLPPKLL